MTPTDAYDQLFYDSLCLPRTHPDHLAAIGRIMGLAAPLPSRCRVLELGCADGGNLIPMAARLPLAECVGVDLSAAQVEAGQEFIDRLGLKNIELWAADVADLTPESLGQFDYVIAHGLYSWVPEPVRAAILPLIRGCLSPGGIGFVSFNILPGWRMRGMLRDILLDAARNRTDPKARIEAAKAALRRLEQGLTGLDGSAANYLRAEMDNLRELPDSYLLYEYLSEHNSAMLFRDFLDRCTAAGLRYLSDAEPARNFPSTYGDGVDAALADIQDGAEMEQWLDFLANRNFREALLIRDDADCDEQIDLGRFAELCFSADLLPAATSQPEPHFIRPDGGDQLTLRHPLTRYLLDELARHYPDAVPLVAVLPKALARFNPANSRLEGANAEAFEAAIAELFGLFARGQLRAMPEPRAARQTIPECPRASDLARAQAQLGKAHMGATQLATIDHGNLGLDAQARHVVRLLDGSRAFPALVVALLGAAPDLERPKAEHQVRHVVGLCRRYGLLAAGCSDA